MSTKPLRAAALLGAVTITATVAAQDELSKSDESWMEKEVGAIITESEIATFQEIDKDDRKLFKELFWMRRDFNPATPDNEYQDIYEQRVEIADDTDLFSPRGIKGSESDMGRIFLLLGNPDSTQRGGAASVEIPESGGAGTGPGGDPEGPGSGGVSDFGESLAGSNQTMTWVYGPNPSLGIPDGLAVEFRQQQAFGYRITNLDDIEESLERVKQRLISNAGISYARNEDGRLRKPDDKFDPNSPAKQLLKGLRETGETSSGMAFTAEPVYFRASGGQIYIPLDIVISEGLNRDEVTVFGSVENADGFEIYQFEEPAKANKTADGNWAWEMPLQLDPGLYTLYLGVLDGASKVHGTQIMDLDVPDFNDGEFELSSVLMFASAEQSGDASAVPGKAFLIGGYHFTPKRELVYTHSDQLSGVFNAYNFGVAGDEPNLTVQVFFFKGDEKRGQTADSPFLLMNSEMALTIFDVPLNIPNFEDPGNYRLEIKVTDHVTNEVLTEKIDFVVEGDN